MADSDRRTTLCDKLNISSLNCEGLKRSSDYIKDYLSTHSTDILCLQETWLVDQNLCNLGNIHCDYLFHGKSGVDSNVDIIRGRPYGGVALLYKKSIAKNVTSVSIDNSRLCGIMLHASTNFKILILCVYMPCDNMSNTHTSTQYADAIDDIEGALNKCECDAVIITGDLNTSFQRDNAQTRCLNAIIARNNIKVCWDSPKITHDYTYVNHSLGHKSCIDHFLLSCNLFDALVSGGVHYDPTNPSSHNIVNIEFQCATEYIVTRNEGQDVLGQRCVWHKASNTDIEWYKSYLDIMLGSVSIPHDALLCRDITCNKCEHRSDIDKFCKDIIDCCIVAGRDNIPLRKYTKRSIAGWKEIVKPEKERSLFWHWIWLESGKPNTGHVYCIMKQTRAKYHYAVRCAKRNEFNVKKQKLAEYAANNSVDMWHELKKINPTCRNISNTIDNACGAQEIADLFKSKYAKLYSSVPTSQQEMESIKSIVNIGVTNEHYDDVKLSPDVIINSIRRIKAGKSDGNIGFDSDHLLNGTNKLYHMITLLFNVMISHGHSARDLLTYNLVLNRVTLQPYVQLCI